MMSILEGIVIVRKYTSYGVAFLICMALMGCASNESAEMDSNHFDVRVAQLTQENIQLQKQVDDLQKAPSEAFMQDLRENLNLTFKIIEAMNNKNHAFLESVSAPGIVIDQVNSQIVFTYGDHEVISNYLDHINIGNLEYWGSGYDENMDKFQIIIAHFFEETYSTIYFDFIKKDNRWLLNGFVTNA